MGGANRKEQQQGPSLQERVDELSNTCEQQSRQGQRLANEVLKVTTALENIQSCQKTLQRTVDEHIKECSTEQVNLATQSKKIAKDLDDTCRLITHAVNDLGGTMDEIHEDVFRLKSNFETVDHKINDMGGILSEVDGDVLKLKSNFDGARQKSVLLKGAGEVKSDDIVETTAKDVLRRLRNLSDADSSVSELVALDVNRARQLTEQREHNKTVELMDNVNQNLLKMVDQQFKAVWKALEGKAESSHTIEQRFSSIDKMVDQQFKAVWKALEGKAESSHTIEQRFSSIDKMVDQQFKAVWKALEGKAESSHTVEQRLSSIDQKFKAVWVALNAQADKSQKSYASGAARQEMFPEGDKELQPQGQQALAQQFSSITSMDQEFEALWVALETQAGKYQQRYVDVAARCEKLLEDDNNLQKQLKETSLQIMNHIYEAEIQQTAVLSSLSETQREEHRNLLACITEVRAEYTLLKRKIQEGQVELQMKAEQACEKALQAVNQASELKGELAEVQCLIFHSKRPRDGHNRADTVRGRSSEETDRAAQSESSIQSTDSPIRFTDYSITHSSCAIRAWSQDDSNHSSCASRAIERR